VRDRGRQAIVAVAVVAFLLRAIRLLQDGPTGPLGHDDEVYFAAAGLFATGAIPYEEFVLLHPPGILVLVSPIALLGDQVIGYLDAFSLARWLSCLVGAVNTALVGLIALRWRGAGAGIVAAALYAAFPPAIEQERLSNLEPAMNLFLLVGLTRWLSRSEEPRSRADIAFTGSAVGLAGAIKLTGGTALLACLLVGPYRRALRDRLALVAWAGAAFLLVALPFALRAGVGDFVRQVFVTQLQRPAEAGAISTGEIEGLPERSLSMLAFIPDPEAHLPTLAGPLLLGIGIALAVWGWSRGGRVGRFLAVMWGIAAAQLLVAPQFYDHYALLLAPASCLLIGGAAQAAAASLSAWPGSVRVAAIAAIAAIPVLGGVTTLAGESPGSIPKAPGVELPADACVYADSTGLVFTLDRLPVAPDPRGEPLYVGLREGSHRTETDAILSEPAQRRLREIISACDYVVLQANLPRTWSPGTRASFLAGYELIATSTEAVELWRRKIDGRPQRTGGSPPQRPDTPESS
jgi:hypothetical protein